MYGQVEPVGSRLRSRVIVAGTRHRSKIERTNYWTLELSNVTKYLESTHQMTISGRLERRPKDLSRRSCAAARRPRQAALGGCAARLARRRDVQPGIMRLRVGLWYGPRPRKAARIGGFEGVRRQPWQSH